MADKDIPDEGARANDREPVRTEPPPLADARAATAAGRAEPAGADAVDASVDQPESAAQQTQVDGSLAEAPPPAGGEEYAGQDTGTESTVSAAAVQTEDAIPPASEPHSEPLPPESRDAPGLPVPDTSPASDLDPRREPFEAAHDHEAGFDAFAPAETPVEHRRGHEAATLSPEPPPPPPLSSPAEQPVATERYPEPAATAAEEAERAPAAEPIPLDRLVGRIFEAREMHAAKAGPILSEPSAAEPPAVYPDETQPEPIPSAELIREQQAEAPPAAATPIGEGTAAAAAWHARLAPNLAPEPAAHDAAAEAPPFANLQFETASSAATTATAAHISPTSPHAPAPANIDEPPGVFTRLRAGAGRAIRYALLGAVFYGAFVLILIAAYRVVSPPVSTLMLFKLAEGNGIDKSWASLGDISPNLVRAVIVAEDGRFCDHWGVDLSAISEAIEQAGDGLPRGGSTISMQLTKNLFLWPYKSYVRKAIELPLTAVIEVAWPKWRILEIYLNVVEFGPGVYGAEAAARYHFGKSASRLSEREAALLAAVLPNPIAREAGSPNSVTSRKAGVIQARMRNSGGMAACVLDR